MSLFESSVSREMLSDTAGLPADVSVRDGAFAALLQLSLFDREGGRFTALPLTRSFAFAELQADASRALEVRNRWVGVLLDFARPFAEIGWIWHNLSELSVEGVHLVTLSAWALQMDRADVFVGVAPALEFYYDITGQWNERLSTNETGVRFARLLGDAMYLFTFLRNLCGLLGQRGRYSEALNAITEALKVARQNEQPAWEIKALLSLSGLMRRQHEFERSVEYCNAALEKAELVDAKGRNAAIASVRYELGKIARDRGEWSVAEGHFRTSRDVFGYLDESGHFDIARAWGVLTNLGYVTFKLGALDEAARIHEQCLEYCLGAGSRGSVATLLTRLAEIEIARGDSTAALRHASEALVWTARLGMVHEHSEAKKLLALIEDVEEPVESSRRDQVQTAKRDPHGNE
jgi:LuxR family glucitol operon transcriptional activator